MVVTLVSAIRLGGRGQGTNSVQSGLICGGGAVAWWWRNSGLVVVVVMVVLWSSWGVLTYLSV